MMSLQGLPTGHCWCGCDGATKGTFFLAGHDKKSESMMSKLKYGADNSVALRLVHEGYGPSGENLLATYKAGMESASKGRLDSLSFQALNEVLREPGIVEAVVFTGPALVRGAPIRVEGGEPQPAMVSALDVPGLGSIVGHGFAHVLSKEERSVEQARVGGSPHMWMSRTSTAVRQGAVIAGGASPAASARRAGAPSVRPSSSAKHRQSAS